MSFDRTFRFTLMNDFRRVRELYDAGLSTLPKALRPFNLLTVQKIRAVIFQGILGSLILVSF